MRSRSFFGVATALVASSLFAGQEGALRVTVLKPDQTPLVGVQISATVAVTSPTQINSAIVVKTNEKGVADFYKLSPGIFTIQVEVSGWAAGAIRTDVEPDHTSYIKVLLHPLPAVEVSVEDSFDTLDPTSVTTGLNVKPEMINTIPIGKRISDQAMFVPGVYLNPVPAARIGGSQTGAGDPSLMVSVSRDMFGQNGYSTNNYLLDGIDTSNPVNGRGTVNIMTDLISDIDIKTGGVSAEYSAKNGIFYNTTTINGGNEFHGGVSLDYTPNALRSKGKTGRPQIDEQSLSTGFFCSGPIVKEKLWFVVAAQKLVDDGHLNLPEGTAAYPGESRSFTGNNELNVFTKLTWQINPANRVIGEYHSNRSWSDNGDDKTMVTNWVQKTDAGGDRYLLWYSFQQPWMIADIKFGHDYQRSFRNDLNPGEGDSVRLFSLNDLSPVQSEFGSYGQTSNRYADRDDLRADFLVPFNAGPASHTLKFGYEKQTSKYSFDQTSSYPYRQDIDQSMSFGDISDNGLTWLPYFVSNALDAINNNPTYSSIKSKLLQPGQTVVDYATLAAYQFNEQDSAHPGNYLVFKSESLLGSNPSIIRTEMSGFYLQDYMTWGGVTFNPGFRVDNYKLRDDLGAQALSVKGYVAPRVGLSWDIKGDAKSKLFAYFGRYYNPVFGETMQDIGLTKSTGMKDSLRMFGQWVDVFDAQPEQGYSYYVFQNDFKMPHTDEYRLGFERIFKLSKAIHTFSLIGTYRADKDIPEALDPYTYSDADGLEQIARGYWNITNPAGQLTSQEQRIIGLFRSLALPITYFAGGGHSGTDNLNNYSEVYVNMPGAFRHYTSVDASYKIETEKTLFFASYTWLDAEGNTTENGLSTANGTSPQVDPRLPWMKGHLDGSLDWQAKVYGSYKFDGDFIVGLFGRMNSGYHYTPSVGSYLVPDVPQDVNAVDAFRLGTKMTPKQVQFDLHLEKRFTTTKHTQLWLSANVFNVFNNQNGLALAEGTNVRSGVAADQPYVFNPPRVVSISAKLRF